MLNINIDDLLRENDRLKKENARLKEENETIKKENLHLKKLLNIVPEKNGINKFSSEEEKISLFRSLFKSREDVFALRWYNKSTDKSGYSPVCEKKWSSDCDIKKGCKNCKFRVWKPLSDEDIRAHLMGKDSLCRDVVGVYPIANGKTYFLVIDFDDGDWKADASAIINICRRENIPYGLERSRSGEGAHVWFFFLEPVSAADARRFGAGIITEAMNENHKLKLSSYDRLLPNQDQVSEDGLGNLIALPLQGQARKNNNSVFVDDNFEVYPDQWEYLYSLQKISESTVNEVIQRFCKNGDVGFLPYDKPWQSKKEPISAMDFMPPVEITEANLLYVRKKGISERGLNYLKRLAAFSNPEFYKKQAMRLSVKGIPRIIDCSEEFDEYIGLPRGLKDKLFEKLESENIGFLYNDERNCGDTIDVEFNGALYPQQQIAADCLLNYENGVLAATTAFGKTVIGSYLIGKRKVNTLILVHTSALLNQWFKALSNFLEINEKLPDKPVKRGKRKQTNIIGLLGNGKNDLHNKVDIAIMQSLDDENDGKALVENYGMVIVDECHHVSAFTFERILKRVKAKYVYGLTATAIRQDGHHPIIFMQCGPIRFEVSALEQAQNSEAERFVWPVITSMVADENAPITRLMTEITENEKRNKLIVDKAEQCFIEGRTPIILTERKSHAELLDKLLKERQIKTFLLTGEGTAKTKRERLEEIKQCTDNFIIIATGKYVGEGFDEPRLDTLLLAMPISWKGTIAQYAGRLHREYQGKMQVEIYDFVDFKVPVLEKMYRKRLKGYREIGYSVKACEDGSVAAVYDGKYCFPQFYKDIGESRKEVIISSAKLSEKKTLQIADTIQNVGAKLTIITNLSDKNELLRFRGIKIDEHEQVYRHFAVIDKSIVWYGDVNLLYYAGETDTMIRIVDRSLAGELLQY